jgi:glycosyltransferase involved in cell wall biosynthesis
MPEPVPILLLTRALGHGGGERQLAITALSLDRSRYLPHVASAESGFWAPVLEQAGIPLHSIRSRGLLTARGAAEMWRLRSYIARRRIRLVQTFDYATNVYAIPVARSVRGVAALSNLRCHMDLIPARDRRLNYFSHRLATAVVTNSEAVRRHLIGDYDVDPRKVFVCLNALDTSSFRSGPRERVTGLESASLVIGVVCVLRPEKNLPVLLEAFADTAAARPGVTLLIVGSGPEEGRLRELASRLRLGERCVFRPSTPDVAPYLRSIDVFVLPSLSEGLSNSIMEAMASGCCVVASSVGGTPELIEDGVSGLLFPPRDAATLASALRTVIDDPDRRNALGAAAAGRIQARFSIAASVERMQAIYDVVLGNPDSPISASGGA